MTDLTAYEQALVERVARALFRAENFDPNEPSPNEPLPCPPWRRHYPDARSALSALGLIGPSRTAWLAPWEASEGMEEGGDRVCNGACHLGSMMDAIFAAMRDAHLKEGGA